MGVEVKLMSQGHLPLSDIRDVLDGMRAGPATFRVHEYMEPGDVPASLATFAFKDPTDRRSGREMRVYHYRQPGPRTQAFVSGDEYTSVVMGAGGGGPAVIQALAERYGGLFENEDGETEEMFPYPGVPTP